MCLVIGPSFSSLKRKEDIKKNKDLSHRQLPPEQSRFQGMLTVKSRKTRFRDPLLRAMRAALGWFTMAFWARGAEPVPPPAGCLGVQSGMVNLTLQTAYCG